jgi:hypothetical protein
MLAPKAFPTTTVSIPEKTLIMEVTNSGIEVPKASKVTPAIKGFILNFLASFSVMEIKKSALFTKIPRLPKSKSRYEKTSNTIN